MEGRLTRWGLALAAAAALGFIAGCGSSHPLMPLALHRSWNYRVRYGLDQERVEPVEVVRGLSVAGTHGYELAGPMGTSRLAWRGNILYADETANAFFDPSIPLAVAGGPSPRPWTGKVTVNGRAYLANAEFVQSQRPVALSIAGHGYTPTMTRLTLHLLPNRGTLELDSWFEPGIGIVQQEQRTNDDRVIQIEYIGG